MYPSTRPSSGNDPTGQSQHKFSLLFLFSRNVPPAKMMFLPYIYEYTKACIEQGRYQLPEMVVRHARAETSPVDLSLAFFTRIFDDSMGLQRVPRTFSGTIGPEMRLGIYRRLI